MSPAGITHHPRNIVRVKTVVFYVYFCYQDEATNTSDAEMGIPLPHPHTIHIPGILTIVALSFHDIFEGLALGIQVR